MVEHAPPVQYNLEVVRADFEILAQEHSPGKPLVFLDNAASSQRPRAVLDGMTAYYTKHHANVHRGVHKLSEEATTAYESARDKVQGFINAASRREIIFTRGTTESLNLVAQSYARANLEAGDVVLATQMEHHSNIVPWQMLAEQTGIRVLYVPLTEDGRLDMDAFRRMLADEPVKLVTLLHVSNVLGTINPVETIIQEAHEAGARVVIDGAQSVPHMPVDVQALDVDFLAFSGHKMAGPTGIGILYGKGALLDAMPPWVGGGDMIERVTLEGSTWNELPYKFEAGTPAIAEAVGLGCAVDYLQAIGMANIMAHEQALTAYAMRRLSQLENVKVYGPEADSRMGVTAFEIAGLHANDTAQMLDTEGIAVRSGHHCAQPLHDLLGVSSTARASFYLYNTFEEVDALVAAIEKTKRLFGI